VPGLFELALAELPLVELALVLAPELALALGLGLGLGLALALGLGLGLALGLALALALVTNVLQPPSPPVLALGPELREVVALPPALALRLRLALKDTLPLPVLPRAPPIGTAEAMVALTAKDSCSCPQTSGQDRDMT
jgi:hypothetical protein